MRNENSYEPGECYNYPLIIKKLLTTPMVVAPDQEIVYRDQFRYTYRQMIERVHRLAGGLTDIGVNAGDTVAFMDWDSHRYLEAYFAIPMMGAVLQMVNWRLSADQILYTLNHAEPKVLFIHTDFLPIWQAIKDKAPSVGTVIALVDQNGPAAAGLAVDNEYENMLAGAKDHFDFPDLDENTKATTFYTTGTTGNPKGVHFSHRQLVLHTLGIAVGSGCYENVGGFRSRDVYMPLTPMFHVHAWGYPYISTLLGTKQVYPGKYEPEMLLRLIITEKVTFSHCVPTILQMLLASPPVQKLDLSHWKVSIGGAPLSKGLARMAVDAGIDIVAGYGMSETCPVVSVARPKDHMMEWDMDRRIDILTKTGLPMPLVEIEVADSDGTPLPHDGASAGEVVLRAPWLTMSYHKAPEKTAELWNDGWLHTGDIGIIDEEGYLKITDRIKDVIKSGGEWISSLDLEDVISRHPAVLESAAIGVPDAKWGERPLMLVVPKKDVHEPIGIDHLKEHMAEAASHGLIPRYAVPDKYVILEEIPKTSVGKIDKKTIRQKYADGEYYLPGR
jgi:fatty-acyl-CoA synthase